MKAVAAFLLVLCCLAVGHAWRCTEGPQLSGAQMIDAGLGKVVALGRYGYPYLLVGNSWYRLGTIRFRHVSTGTSGTWASSTSNLVYRYVAGHFTRVIGNYMQQVDAGGDGQVVGTYSNRGYCSRKSYASPYTGKGRLYWSSISRPSMKYVSCGLYGCWGVDTNKYVYFSRLSPTTCSGSWSYMSLKSAKMVEVGSDGTAFVVTTSGQLWQRRYTSSSYPQGRSWYRVSMCSSVKHVSYDLGTMWAVTGSGWVMKCVS